MTVPSPTAGNDDTPARFPIALVRERLPGARRLIVLDDDPTGTQPVRDVSVITRWHVDDIRWALRRPGPGFYILTNTRSLTAADAADRLREIVGNCMTAARQENVRVALVSRGDSTLRGHFPLEVQTIAGLSGDDAPHTIVLAPAYIEAGRITVAGVHYVVTGSGRTPVGDTEFAADRTFGYRSSRLSDWVAEKAGGAIDASEIMEVPHAQLRAGTSALVHAITTVRPAVVVADAQDDDDVRALAIATLDTEATGMRLLYQAGPSFVRARLGQDAPRPMDDDDLTRLIRSAHARGLVVVGSHVELTTRQVEALAAERDVVRITLDVSQVLDTKTADGHIAAVVAEAARALRRRTVVIETSRTLARAADPEQSLSLSAAVSAALVAVTRQVVAVTMPAYVIAKGGITSSDIATKALGISRAIVEGPLLDGIVSLWRPVDGPAAGLPYVVFAGNVGDRHSLAHAVARMEHARTHADRPAPRPAHDGGHPDRHADDRGRAGGVSAETSAVVHGADHTDQEVGRA